jgi:hypothetical protein
MGTVRRFGKHYLLLAHSYDISTLQNVPSLQTYEPSRSFCPYRYKYITVFGLLDLLSFLSEEFFQLIDSVFGFRMNVKYYRNLQNHKKYTFSKLNLSSGIFESTIFS